jgi:putative FmdB family regulatory protein
MPIYEFACTQCGHAFETLVKTGAVAQCPSCSSTQLEKQLSVFATTKVTEAAPAAMSSPCGSCDHPDWPGGCAFAR